jgi:hypothetical protein
LLIVNDVFEIMEQYATGHEPGLVAILNRIISQDPAFLVGKIALIQTPAGGELRARIDDAREHGAANSLFFRRMKAPDVPVGSAIYIEEETKV